MSASQMQRAEWPDPAFWDRLGRLEAQHQRIQIEHERVSRRLQKVVAARHEEEEVREAWRAYCEVIADLDRTTAELESLRAATA